MAYLSQRRMGMGSYDKVGDWGWEFYPPPYDFLAPLDSVPVPAPILYTPGGGLSGCHCGGGCGGSCAHGMGLFESGLDMTQWGAGEWITAGLGLYLLGSFMGDVGRAKQSVSKSVRRMRRS